MNEEMIRHGLAEVHEGASRLQRILTHSGNVNVAIADMRTAADRFAAALNRDSFGPQEFCDLMNTLFQLSCFFVNSGTGLQQSGAAKMHPIGENCTIEHVRSWSTYFNDMAKVLEQGDDINAWLPAHPLPPGQPGTVSSRLRVTVSRGPDPTEELRYAALVRRNLWAHSPVDVDPDDPRHATHRDGQKRAYFELSTHMAQEVERVIRDYGHADRVTLTDVTREEQGPQCLNCGNVAGRIFPTVCPNCEMREITPCPYCRKEVPRQLYGRVSGDLFICPECRSRVRIHPNSETVTGDGSYNPPLFLVKRTV
jgi:hypothetical protein